MHSMLSIPNRAADAAILAEAERRGVEVREGASIVLTGEISDVMVVAGMVRDLDLTPRRKAEAAEEARRAEWDGFESQRDLVAAMVYNARAQSPREMTPERWAGIKERFPSSVRQCLEQADDELADM